MTLDKMIKNIVTFLLIRIIYDNGNLYKTYNSYLKINKSGKNNLQQFGTKLVINASLFSRKNL